jgi:molybdate transport system substrate-binding protein
MLRLTLCLPFAAALTPLSAGATDVQVAVAANFLSTVRTLATRFEAEHGDRVLVSSGSTGKLYAQISHGAPYDVFLAADVRRPALLERAGLTVPGSRFTYARGRLVLWSRDPQRIDDRGKVLAQGQLKRIALANPKTAPYGAAARAVLMHLNLWRPQQGRMVFGENVGQTFQFAASGNVDAAFVALSQVRQLPGTRHGSLWLVPENLYPPIEQQAVLLKRAEDNRSARAFVAFLRSPAAKRLITAAGYGQP